MPDPYALVSCWQKSGSKVLNSTVAQSGLDGHKSRQVLIFTTKAIAHPRPHTGSHKGIRTRVDFQQGSTMGFIGSMNGFDQTKLIRHLCDMWKEFTDPLSALSMATKGPRTRHEMPGLGELNTGFGKWEWLVMISSQKRLVVEGIDMRRASMHEKENHPLGRRWMMRP